jgi:hypothetical protein
MPPEAVGAFGVPAGTSTLSPVPGTAAGLQFPAVVHAVLTAPVHVLSPPPVPVAAKVTAVRPGALAVKLCAPTVVPSVAPMLASPAPSVTTTALSTLPPPVATANVTGTPPHRQPVVAIHPHPQRQRQPAPDDPALRVAAHLHQRRRRRPR